MVSGGDGRDWLLVAPWYRWARQREAHGWRTRETRPVFQKYDVSDPVSAFVRDPQHSLRFTEEDQVHALAPISGNGGGAGGKRRRLSDSRLLPTGLRKLFLDTHKRFYLVVCELRTDGPGFPCVPRDRACEAGFVVRRRMTAVPRPLQQQAVDLLRELAVANAQLSHLQELAAIDSPALGKVGRSAPGDLVAALKTSVGERLAEQRLAAELDLRQQNLRLVDWAREHGVRPEVQGWVPSGFDGVGGWRAVEDRPGEVVEQVFPLYPLVPDPAVEGHCGRGRTLYFGLVPTGSRDTEADGKARFDDRELYEVRCFVRRHKPGCPKRPTRNDCHGEVVWSVPTEPYRLASHFDLTGTSNRPVTIQLPDLPALAAQAATGELGTLSPVKMVSPPGSALKFRVDDMVPVKTGEPGASICSFSIPLITIIATFVLNLFLPVVVFVFGLWWMLRLKFCIPPSLEVGASVTAALELSGAGIDIDIDAEIDLDPGAGVLFPSAIRADVAASFNAAFDARLDGKTLGGEFANTFGTGLLVEQTADLARDLEADPPPASSSLTARLQYEERVEWQAVGA